MHTSAGATSKKKITKKDMKVNSEKRRQKEKLTEELLSSL